MCLGCENVYCSVLPENLCYRVVLGILINYKIMHEYVAIHMKFVCFSGPRFWWIQEGKKVEDIPKRKWCVLHVYNTHIRASACRKNLESVKCVFRVSSLAYVC